MKIRMKKENCFICHGSGEYSPYPYRRQKKCDHEFYSEQIQKNIDRLKEEAKDALYKASRLEEILNTAEEIE